METPDGLIAAISGEDRLLRACLERCPPDRLEQRFCDDGLSPKDVIGHVAFWDDYVVRFFRSKLDADPAPPPPPADFEGLSQQELERIARLPFATVQDEYDRATGALVTFLRERWQDLSFKQRQDFHVPLRHRRQHRVLLEKCLPPIREDAAQG